MSNWKPTDETHTERRKTRRDGVVYCADCRHFRRDTEGRSYNIYTGEYFMGVCCLGKHPDSPRKQFANKPRRCANYGEN